MTFVWKAHHRGIEGLRFRVCRCLSQEEGESGWYVYVRVCVYVDAYVVNKYITIYVGTLCDLFCAYAMSFDSSIFS